MHPPAGSIWLNTKQLSLSIYVSLSLKLISTNRLTIGTLDWIMILDSQVLYSKYLVLRHTGTSTEVFLLPTIKTIIPPSFFPLIFSQFCISWNLIFDASSYSVTCFQFFLDAIAPLSSYRHHRKPPSETHHILQSSSVIHVELKSHRFLGAISDNKRIVTVHYGTMQLSQSHTSSLHLVFKFCFQR